MNEITYDLTTPFEYAFKGEMRDAAFITVAAPTVSNMSYVARLKQQFMHAMNTHQDTGEPRAEPKEGDKEASLEEMTGANVMALLYMSSIDYAGYLETAKGVFMSDGISLIDGEQKFNKALINKMSVDDLEAMTGEYLRAFILTSVLAMA